MSRIAGAAVNKYVPFKYKRSNLLRKKPSKAPRSKPMSIGSRQPSQIHVFHRLAKQKECDRGSEETMSGWEFESVRMSLVEF